MFYQCQQCQRKWQYPIKECPYCLAPLEKNEGKKAVVRGVVKTAIPTLYHPNIPYYVLLLEDEIGNKWAYKSEKEFKIGEEFEADTNTDKNAVAIWRIKYDPQEAIEQGWQLIGGVNLRPETKVIILPTVSKASHSYFKDNTSPEFLTAVIKLLLARGLKKENIMVGTQSFDETPVSAMAMKAGLIEAGVKLGVMPLDLATSEFEVIGQLEIAKPVLEADLVIDLAMEKVGKASAVNNLFKILKKECYLGQKYLSSEADLAIKLEPIISKLLVVGEAEFVQRSNKLTTFLGLVLTGKSARNVDRIFNEVTQAFKLPEALQNIEIAAIQVVGRTIKEVQYNAEIF